jgi:PAS domain S-box-containing protein
VPGLHGHEPFTALSPTVASDPHGHQYTNDRYSASSRSTPLGAPSFFGPVSAAGPPTEGGVPTPNLYDVVLQLNAEPTLAAWWSTLTTVLREQYRVDRASISIPADTTDIENVPWGQKASFNVAGLRGLMSADAPSTRSGSLAESNSSSSQKADPNARSYANSRLTAMRPTLEQRHSFAGYEMSKTTSTSTTEPRFPSPAPRPGFSRRTTSHVSTTRVPSWTEPTVVPDIPAFNANTDLPSRYDDPDENENESSTSVVLQTLRALDKERDPLLDSAGVNRIVKRSRLVILTRDYTTTPLQAPRESAKSPAVLIPEEEEEEGISQQRSAASSYSSQTSQHIQRNSMSRVYQGANYRTATGRLQQGPAYEEYEQFPSSPWAQSPAPSPAIQKDDDHNPFFATGGLVEETFNPAQVNEDYTKFGQVEAIGVDKASTIIHVPLVHPLLSQTVRSEPEYDADVNLIEARRRNKMVTDSAALELKAPIAILSILSPDVPFSPKLQESLKHIAPHLATSFQTSLQNTTLQERVAGAIHRNQKSGRAAPGSLAISGNRIGLGLGLESLLQFETDDTVSSTMGSIASPSEFSSGTRNSPPGSNLGTPSYDPNAHFASSRHAGSTPGLALEGGDSYFDQKERQPLVRAKSGMPLTQASLAGQFSTSRASTEHRNVLRKTDTSPSNRDHSSDSRKDGKRSRRKDDSAPSATTSPNARRGVSSHPVVQDDAKRTYLHSRGADFNASFQSLPVATMPQPTAGHDQARTSRASEAQDMPPPSERLLRTIIDSLPVQIFTAAPLTGRVTWVNSKFLVYRGQTSQQVLDDPWSTIHREDLAAYTEEWNRSLHTGQQFQHKIRLRRFDDFYRWYYVRAAPLRDKMQNIVHWVGTMIDLHDQHIAEVNAAQQQETAASEAKYRALANSSPQIVFAATKAKGVSFCNTQWVQYSGQTEEQAKGTGFMEYVFPDDLTKCKLPDFDETGEHASNVPITVPTPVRRAKSGSPGSADSSDQDTTPVQPGILMSPGGLQQSQRKLSELASTGILRVNKDSTGRPSYSTEVRLRGKNGEYRWHLVRVLLSEPVRNAVGQEDTWYGTCTDINDHKELEQTLKETMDAKSRFLSNMSHEIRTPLNGIHGMASFLIDSNLSAEQLDHVNVIRSSTEGLRDLINDILDLSKVEAGMITLDYKWLHIRSVIEEVNDLTSSLALAKGLELNYYVDDHVPSMIKGDKFRFRQILLNVIGNAIKFTQQGEVLIRCTLSKDDDHPVSNTSMLKFEVIDTGHGFNEKEAEKLFKRFSQIDGSSTRQHGGTGEFDSISILTS